MSSGNTLLLWHIKSTMKWQSLMEGSSKLLTLQEYVTIPRTKAKREFCAGLFAKSYSNEPWRLPCFSVGGQIWKLFHWRRKRDDKRFIIKIVGKFFFLEIIAFLSCLEAICSKKILRANVYHLKNGAGSRRESFRKCWVSVEAEVCCWITFEKIKTKNSSS